MRTPKLAANAGDAGRSRMMRGSEEKAETKGIEELFGSRQGNRNRRAHGGKHIGAAGFAGGGAGSVLGDRNARRGGDDGGRGRYVEGLGAAGPGPGGVHEASVAGAQHHHAGAHGLGQPDDFIDALSFFGQRNQHGGDLRVGGLAVKDVAEQFGCFRARQVAAGRKLLPAWPGAGRRLRRRRIAKGWNWGEVPGVKKLRSLLCPGWRLLKNAALPCN